MARKYSRDNRGRFASGGSGATARGGRLKTGAGNKRATQTMSAKGAGGAGVIKGRAARTVAGESVMRKLPKAAPKAATVTGKGARVGGDGAKAVVATKQAAYRSASAKSMAAGKESAKYGYKNEPYNPKNFFGGSAVRAANMAKASPEKLAEFKSLQKASSAFSRNRLKAGKANVELSNKAYGMRGAANASRPGTMLKPKAAKPAAPAQAKAAPKAKIATESKLGRAYKRAKGIELKRYAAESSKMAFGSGGYGKESYDKRQAASSMREAKSRRTASAAKSFLGNFGSPSTFGRRPVASTKDSPMFGTKKRGRRK